jgi:hypothetical protein
VYRETGLAELDYSVPNHKWMHKGSIVWPSKPEKSGVYGCHPYDFQ